MIKNNNLTSLSAVNNWISTLFEITDAPAFPEDFSILITLKPRVTPRETVFSVLGANGAEILTLEVGKKVTQLIYADHTGKPGINRPLKFRSIKLGDGR